MLPGWFSKKEACKKYVDLINQASSKWANWDPPVSIEAGDFGTIDQRTGDFRHEGNIYRHDKTSSIVANHPRQQLPTEEKLVIQSKNVREIGQGAGAGGTISGMANVAVSLHFQFTKKRAASLVMHNVRMTVVPNEVLVALKGVEFLKTKVLVTDSFACDGYVLYLSNKTSENVHIALSANASTADPTGSLPSAGVHFDTAWHTEGTAGLLRKGYDQRGSFKFTPLFRAKSVRTQSDHRRDYPDDEPTEEQWNDIDVPWGNLDEEGQESADEDSSEEEGGDEE